MLGLLELKLGNLKKKCNEREIALLRIMELKPDKVSVTRWVTIAQNPSPFLRSHGRDVLMLPEQITNLIAAKVKSQINGCLSMAVCDCQIWWRWAVRKRPPQQI